MELCRLDDVQEGGARGFTVTGVERRIIVVRRHGRIYTYLDSCPHYEGGTPMAWKTDRYLSDDGGHLACHSHGALFEFETGVCVLGPCLGQRLIPVPAHVTPSGGIDVRIDEIAGGRP